MIPTRFYYTFQLKFNFFAITPIIVRLTCLQNKSSLIKLGLIIYVNAGRIVIDYIKPLKITLLEHCKQGAGSIFFQGDLLAS